MNRGLSAHASGIALSVFRVVIGFLFACHGAAKLFGVLGGATGNADTVPVGVWPMWWAGIIELVGGILVAIGLGTRIAALICSGAMAFAYFTAHQSAGLLPIQNLGETAALYSWAFLLIVFLGPGPIAVDSLFRRGRAASPAEPVASRTGRPMAPS